MGRFNKLMRETGLSCFGYCDVAYINKLMELFDDDGIKIICYNRKVVSELFSVHKDYYEKLLLLLKQNILIVKYPKLCSEKFVYLFGGSSEMVSMTDEDFKFIEQNIGKLYDMGKPKARLNVP